MADAVAMRATVESLMTRVLAGGETALAEQLIHPEFVNNEADPERRNGPSGAAATSDWLRSCFGDLRYDIHRIFIDGDMGAAYVTMHGTHEGGLPPGVPATHKPFSVKHVHLFGSRTTVASLSTLRCAMTSAWLCSSGCCPLQPRGTEARRANDVPGVARLRCARVREYTSSAEYQKMFGASVSRPAG